MTTSRLLVSLTFTLVACSAGSDGADSGGSTSAGASGTSGEEGESAPSTTASGSGSNSAGTSGEDTTTGATTSTSTSDPTTASTTQPTSGDPGCADECAAGLYTPCTCGVEDPCGWSGDGTCDASCIGVGEPPFDDSADCTLDHHVACDLESNPFWEPYCGCDADANPGDPIYDGVCKPQVDDDAFCCAGPGYPNGGECGCYWDWGTIWGCIGAFEFCSCGFADTPGDVGLCDNAPGGNGEPWRCCASQETNQCYCAQNEPACAGSYVEVQNCHDVPPGWPTPPTACPDGTQGVAECSPGPDCDADDDCGDGCVGTDLVCCSICNEGMCDFVCG